MSTPEPPAPQQPEPTRIAPQRRPAGEPYPAPPPPSEQPWSPAGATPPPPAPPYAPPAPPSPPSSPPPAPYSQAPATPYGQAPATPYGQAPYGQAPYGQAPYGQAALPPAYGGVMPTYPYAPWVKRVGATVIDGLLTALAGIPLFIGYGVVFASLDTTTNADGVTTTSGSPSPIGLVLVIVGFLTYLTFFIWNTCIRQGRTGQSLGKSALEIRLLKEDSGQPIGAGLSFVRQLVHVVDGFCYVGYLWPLWDKKRQTFADKILTTVVVDEPAR